MPPIVYQRASVTVPATPAQLWPFIADTNRIDHAIGLPEAIFSFSRRAEGGEVAIGSYRRLGERLGRWIEHPFEWEQPRRYVILREYQLGPFTSYRGQVELEPIAGGTLVTVTTEVRPRHWPAWLALRTALAPETARRAVRQYRLIGDFVAGYAAHPFPALRPSRGEVDARRLAALATRLGQSGPADVIERLRRLMADGADEDVASMRPLELAARWRVDPRQTLDLFLRATVEGLLELRWELLCPGCRGVKATAAHLRELAAGGYCPACNRHVIASQDEAIEARFYPTPAVRRAEVGAYCVGSPALTPHRLAQANLAPGAERTWRLTLPPGEYLLSAPQSKESARLVVTAGGAAPAVAARIEPGAIRPSRCAATAGPVAIQVTNALPVAATVALDDARWSRTGATPARLMASPSFRDLFSSEALAPGVELAVARVGLIFTDLAGSTALYERVGEARAFRLVSEHFDLLRAAIEAAGGALIKTLGDAIMAAFPDGRAAMTAALAMQRAIRRLDTRGLADPRRLLKVGVHAGPCYLVTLNDRLDYFGTAVNLTARAQQEARGGEVVVTASVFDEERDDAARAGLPAETFTARVRGLAEPVRLYRFDCAAWDDAGGVVAAASACDTATVGSRADQG